MHAAFFTSNCYFVVYTVLSRECVPVNRKRCQTECRRMVSVATSFKFSWHAVFWLCVLCHGGLCVVPWWTVYCAMVDCVLCLRTNRFMLFVMIVIQLKLIKIFSWNEEKCFLLKTGYWHVQLHMCIENQPCVTLPNSYMISIGVSLVTHRNMHTFTHTQLLAGVIQVNLG